MTLKYLAKVQDNKLKILDRKFIDRLKKLEGNEVWITVNKKVKIRSDNQNRYYWGVVIKIVSEELGYTEDETHTTLKSMFLTDNAGKLPKVKSTADLSTSEFEKYVEDIRRKVAELGINVPTPNEVPFEF